jgi:phosphate transport system substrate-binding protein
MRRLILFCSWAGWAWFCLLLLPVAEGEPVQAEPIAVIVNKANETDDLSDNELARIYRGDQESWPDGQRIMVIDRPVDSDIRRAFYLAVLHADASQKFLKPGSPVPFKAMESKSGLATRRLVARIPNAIGYVLLGEVDANVKVLRINGKLPGEAGYPLEH